MHVTRSPPGALRLTIGPINRGERLRYDIVVVGFRLNARLKPAEAMHSVLGVSPDAARELVREFPATVLCGVSQGRAERVSRELNEAGAKVEVRESRISLAAQADEGSAGGAFPTNEYSGNYEIGEILAPMPRRSASSAPGAATASAAPMAKRPSREELDAALRESFKPPPGHGGEHDAAFAGLTNFGDDLDGFGAAEAPVLDVDEEALRSIRRSADADVPATSKPSLAERLLRSLSRLLDTAGEYGVTLFSLGVITAITLLAVGYALNPHDPLGAVRGLPAYVRDMFAGGVH